MSSSRPLSFADEFHATTRTPQIRVSSWISCSVNPSLRYSWSGPLPRLLKGSTATVGSGSPSWGTRRPARPGDGRPSAASRAAATCRADSNRRSGCFSRERRTIAATAGAVAGGSTGLSLRIAAIVSTAVAPSNARRPVSIS